jgi:N-acetylglucosamine malate deacetylase 1
VTGARGPVTLLVALSHPDDEVGCAGTIAAHVAAGDHAVLLWLTHGEMTESLGPLTTEEVARRRVAQGEHVAGLLGAEPRFLSFPDTGMRAGPEGAREVARVIADVRPAAVITWGDAWIRGMRHPDHRETGIMVRDAITLARIAKAVAPAPPHREPAPVFTIRDEHSTLPLAAVDVTAHLDTVLKVGRYYHERVGWPDPEWLRQRVEAAGRAWGVGAAETFDSWEAGPGLRRTLV